MNDKITILFVSDSAADEVVLTTLTERNADGGAVVMRAASDAQAFFDALHAEQSYQIIVIDERQVWSEWTTVAAACAQHRPDAMVVLLVDADRRVGQEMPGQENIVAAYPRSSVGLLALSKLVAKIATQSRSFSLRRDATEVGAGDAGEAGTEERERLVYAVSHDLQDPLQLARRYAEILNEDFEHELGDSGSKVLEHLQFNLARTQEMLDELLDFSRLQSAEPEREPVDLNELLDEAIAIYKVQLDEIGASVSRQHDLPTLDVDRRQFQRVFQNLIGNAIKFRSDRPLHITVRAQRVRDEWRIGIKDNGIGIAEEDSKRIFGMFERGGAGDDFPGTGMGLAICKRIVNNHGGKIWVRSSPGSGSVFIFSIPQRN